MVALLSSTLRSCSRWRAHRLAAHAAVVRTEDGRGRLAHACAAGRDVLGDCRDPRDPGRDLRGGVAQSRCRGVVLGARANGARQFGPRGRCVCRRAQAGHPGRHPRDGVRPRPRGPASANTTRSGSSTSSRPKRRSARCRPSMWSIPPDGRLRAPSLRTMPDRGPVTPEQIAEAQSGTLEEYKVVVLDEGENAVSALVKLHAFVDAYLLVTRNGRSDGAGSSARYAGRGVGISAAEPEPLGNPAHVRGRSTRSWRC